MEIEYLENFIVLAQYQNFGEAADLQFMSQSALSKRIKKLEEQIGVVLFNRTTKSVELNEYGTIFLKYAEKIVSLEKECLLEIRQKLPENQRYFKVGALPSFAEYHITELISSFMRKSDVWIKVITAPSEKLESMLENNECDFAFIRQVHDANHKFLKIPIVADRLVAIIPKEHKLTHYSSLEIKQLRNERFIMQTENSRPYNFCRSLCRKNGFDPNIIFTDSQIKNIVDFVEKGLGISLLMEKVANDSLTENVKVIPITPTIENIVMLCSLRTKLFDQSQKDFLTFIRNQTKV